VARPSGCDYDSKAGFDPIRCSDCVANCVTTAKQATGETRNCFVHLCSAAFIQEANACKQARCQDPTMNVSPVCAVSCPPVRHDSEVVVPPSLILVP
jgi:hypothetical protein